VMTSVIAIGSVPHVTIDIIARRTTTSQHQQPLRVRVRLRRGCLELQLLSPSAWLLSPRSASLLGVPLRRNISSASQPASTTWLPRAAVGIAIGSVLHVRPGR
jgi:hypothetical protein